MKHQCPSRLANFFNGRFTTLRQKLVRQKPYRKSVGYRFQHVIAALWGVAGLASAPACAQTISGQVDTVVVDRLSLVNSERLDFGTLISGPAAGTVTVSTAGTRTVTGGVLAAGANQKPGVYSGTFAVTVIYQ